MHPNTWFRCVAPRSWRALALTALLTASLAGPAQAATGSLLRSITAANPGNCGVNVGVAFDGKDLLVSCVIGNGTGNARIDYINAANGSLVRTLVVPGHNGLAALAYDSGRQKIWACDNPSGSNSPGAGSAVYLIDPLNPGSSTRQFTSAGCWDGLAYDGSDDTVWTSPDQSNTIYHYTSGGTLLSQHSGLTAELGNFGNSGIAVGGPNLYLSSPDTSTSLGNGTIYTTPKNFSSAPAAIATEPSHIEDMECDSVTFAPKDAMWVISAFNRTLDAYEIPAGSCGVGGLASAPPRPVLGKSLNLVPVSGQVFVKLPGSASLASTGAITKGQGFIPLAAARQLPTGTLVDARAGSLEILAAPAAGRVGKLQSGVFKGGLYRITQAGSGVQKGLTTLKLVEGAFQGAPSFSSCRAHKAAGVGGPLGFAASYLQYLRSRVRGRYRTSGRYSASTVRGTVWDTIEQCNGTLTVVHRGTVAVTDFVHHKTVLVHAGHRYLARKP